MIGLQDLLFISGNSIDKVFASGTAAITIPAGSNATISIPHSAGEIPLYTVYWSHDGTTWFPAGYTDGVTNGAYSPTSILAYTDSSNLYIWGSITGAARTVNIRYELYYLEDN